MVCIGYAGIEAFDVILYIGRTLTKLKYRVLIIDLSDTDAIAKSIKHGMDLDSRKEIVNYRDINYMRRYPTDEELETFKDAVVFIVYGYNYENSNYYVCKSVNIVVNTFPYIIDRIRDLIPNVAEHDSRINVLIRDIVTLDDVDRVKKSLLHAKFERTDYLYLDLTDYECAVKCQMKQIIKFTAISSRMEKYITDQINEILPDIKKSRIKKAVSDARKGA